MLLGGTVDLQALHKTSIHEAHNLIKAIAYTNQENG